MAATVLAYARFMDDWVILPATRWKLRAAIRLMNETSAELRHQHTPRRPSSDFGIGMRGGWPDRAESAGMASSDCGADQGQPPRALAAAAVLAWTTAMVRGGTWPE